MAMTLNDQIMFIIWLIGNLCLFAWMLGRYE